MVREQTCTFLHLVTVNILAISSHSQFPGVYTSEKEEEGKERRGKRKISV